MESEEIRELRATLLRLKQEHRDLDSAINALEESGRADALQLKRLKKKKLYLKEDRPHRGPAPPRHHRLAARRLLSYLRTARPRSPDRRSTELILPRG
jgi:hypothetical protein